MRTLLYGEIEIHATQCHLFNQNPKIRARHMPIHWYLAANLRIVIYNWEMVLTDDTATVGGIFMIFSRDTHEISFLIKW